MIRRPPRSTLFPTRRSSDLLLPDGHHPLVAAVAKGKRVELRPRKRTGERRRGWERLEGEEVVAALRERRVGDDQDALRAVGLGPLERHPAADRSGVRGAERGRLETLVACDDRHQGEEGSARAAVRHASNLRGAARGVNLTAVWAGNNVKP